MEDRLPSTRRERRAGLAAHLPLPLMKSSATGTLAGSNAMSSVTVINSEAVVNSNSVAAALVATDRKTVAMEGEVLRRRGSAASAHRSHRHKDEGVGEHVWIRFQQAALADETADLDPQRTKERQSRMTAIRDAVLSPDQFGGECPPWWPGRLI